MTDLSSSIIYGSLTPVIFSLPAQFGQYPIYSACTDALLWPSLALIGSGTARIAPDREQVDMAWKLVLALVVILILAGIGLAVYGGQLTPERQRFEQVLPDERFPD